MTGNTVIFENDRGEQIRVDNVVHAVTRDNGAIDVLYVLSDPHSSEIRSKKIGWDFDIVEVECKQVPQTHP